MNLTVTGPIFSSLHEIPAVVGREENVMIKCSCTEMRFIPSEGKRHLPVPFLPGDGFSQVVIVPA